MDRETLKSKLRTFIAEEILVRPDFPIRDHDPLISGGLMDSFSLAQLAVFVEDEFKISIPDSRLTAEDLDTINAMADLVLALHDQ